LAEGRALIDGEQPGHVLDEQHRSSTLARDSPDFGPEPSCVVGSSSFAGDACTLAGETGSDEIHSAAKRSAVEGFQIVEDRAATQGTFDHSTCEDACRVGLPLDRSHNAKGRANHPDPELDASVSAAQGDGT